MFTATSNLHRLKMKEVPTSKPPVTSWSKQDCLPITLSSGIAEVSLLKEGKDCDFITFCFLRLRRKMSAKGSDRKKYKFYHMRHVGIT